MKSVLLFLSFFLSFYLFSQEDNLLSRIKNSGNSSVSGSFGALGTFYNVNGVEARRDPFFWQFNANLQINYMGVSIPFSAVISQQQRNFTQPFNQFGLSPKYKAITTHIGYRSMNFSEFSLNGNQFLGLGVEINPEKSLVRGKVLYGRFNKAVDGYYSDGLILGTPSYERWGYGAAIDLGTQKNKVGFVFFRASDDVNSIADFQNDATIKPEQNLVFGLNTEQKITKKLSLSGEIDWSAYTRDLRQPEEVLEGYTFLNNLGSLFQANGTSSFSKAMEANLKYKLKNIDVNLGYRRVDPEYRTMGSVYLNNDFENITAKLRFKFLKKKLAVSTSGGLQRNNLNNDQVSAMRRVIGSLSLNYSPSEKWNFSTTMANYSTQSQMTLINSTIGEDTLKYAQVSKNASLQINRNIKIGKNRGGIQSGFNYQTALINGVTNSNFIGGQIGFNYALTAQKIQMALNLSVNNNTTETTDLLAVGPNLLISKMFLENKLNISCSGSYLQSYLFGDLSGEIINTRLGVKYKLGKAHQVFSNISLGFRDDAVKKYTELIASIGYKFNFRR